MKGAKTYEIVESHNLENTEKINDLKKKEKK